jgi:hypothetical protein
MVRAAVVAPVSLTPSQADANMASEKDGEYRLW